MRRPNPQSKVSAIIPVYNEEKTVAGVVKALLLSDLVDEIICVNDGSTDNSLKLLKSFGKRISLINLKENKGKGFALATGIKKANGKIVGFFDADLVNLSKLHIKKMVKPILTNKYRAVICYREKSPYPSFLCKFISSPLTGERAYFRKDLLSHLNKMGKTGFGVEVFLNDLYKTKKIKKVGLKNLRLLYKYEKTNFSKALKDYLDEAMEIIKEVSRQEKLSLDDIKIINQLKRVSDLKNWREKVSKISNKKLKLYLKKYIIKYLQKAYSWWEKHKPLD